jgi:hypothetical protein
MQFVFKKNIKSIHLRNPGSDNLQGLFHDPKVGGSLQHYNPYSFATLRNYGIFLFPDLTKTSFRRSGNKKIPTELSFGGIIMLRRGGDSNPRYPNRVRQFSKLVD